MTRVLAVVEGASEEQLLKRLLVPHLARHGVFLSAMKVLRGKGARGGGSSWQPWRSHIDGLLKKQAADVKVTTFLDLYRIPRDAPGFTPDGKGAGHADAMLEAMREQFDCDGRFLPYIQVHEFEALLYSDLSTLTAVEPTLFPAKMIDALARQVAHLAPEAINEGDATAPSKRILSLSPHFGKIEHGVQAAERIGLQLLRQKCPRFGAWVSQLEGSSQELHG